MRTNMIRERSAFSVMMRLHWDGDDVTQSDLSAISYKVYPEGGGTVVATGNLSVATTIFDTLQTGEVWQADSIGYNFRHDVASTAITTPGRFVFEYKITPLTGSPFFCDSILVVASTVLTP